MKFKIIRLKKLHLFIAVILISTSLMGVGYAYWTESLIMTGTFKTSKISLKKISIDKNFPFSASSCLSICEINPKITVNNDGKLPIQIDSVEIVDLNYYATRYNYWAEYVDSWSWCDWHDDWEANCIPYISRDESSMLITTTIKKTIPFRNLRINEQMNQDITLPIYSNLWWEEDLGDYIQQEVNDNLDDYNYSIDNIDVDEPGTLTVKVNYTQWNTLKGWRKTLTIQIPVDWSRRKNWQVNTYPDSSNQNPYAFKTTDERVQSKPKPQ